MRRMIRIVLRRSVGAVRASSASLLYAFLISALAAPPMPAQTAASEAEPASAGAPELRQDQLQDYFNAMREMRDSLSRAEFDPAAVVAEIGNDPGALRDWVAEHTAWIPYAGHLRPPSAVMLDGTGNSLDRAALLARLLTLAGHKPRLATAEVSADWVEQHLLAGIPRDGDLRPPVLPEEMNIPDGIRDPAQRAAVNRYVTGRQQTLVDTLGRVESQLPLFAERLPEEKPVPSSSLPGATTHWWVELGEEDNLLKLDPSGAPALTATERFTPEELPADTHQTLEVRIQVEQWKDGKRSEETALSHTFRSGIDGNAHFQIGFTPKDVSLDFAAWLDRPDETLGAFRDSVAAADHWVPHFQIGSESIVDRGFTSTGEVNRDHEASAQGAAVQRAAGLLGGLGGGSARPAGRGVLSRVSVEFILRGPGLEPETRERVVYERDVDPAEDLSGNGRIERGLAFAGSTEVLMQTSVLRRDAVTIRALDHALSNRSALLGTLHYMERDDAANLQKSVEKLSAFPGELYEFALTRFMLNANQQRVHIARPNLIARQRRLSQTEEGTLRATVGFDLIHTEVDAVPGDPAPRLRRLEQGMVDAALESVMAGSAGEIVSASGLLERIPAEEWIWLEDEAGLDALGGTLDDGVRRRLLDAIKAGNSVYVPRNLAELDASRAAWWELSADTGVLVGRIATGGWGGTSTEYLINFYVAKAAMTLLAISAAACADSPSFGCIACNVISGALIIGGIFAPGPGTALAVVIANMIANLGCAIATS